MPTIDPGFSASDPNNCLYMEANANDGGTHSATFFWMSQDILMTNPDTSFAKEGVVNTTNVKIHGNNEGCSMPEAIGFAFDLYVCTPSLNITTAAASSVLLSTAGGQVVPNISLPTPVNWTPISDTTKPNGHGHRCLIARCYPIGTTADPSDLGKYVVDDHHYAQHNLTIDVTPPAAPRRQVPVRTGNAGKESERVTIQVVQDFNPTDAVLQAILPSLRTVAGFKQIATTPVRHISLDFDDFKKHDHHFEEKLEMIVHVIVDAITGLFGKKPHPNLEAKITIPPNVIADIAFEVDTTGTRSGDAHVFHLTQQNQQGTYQGGLTVVFVTV